MWIRPAAAAGLLLLAMSGKAAAQDTNILLGAGASGFNDDGLYLAPHLIGGAEFDLSSHLGLRLDGTYVTGADSYDGFFEGTADLVVQPGNPAAHTRGYFLVGLGVAFPDGDPSGGITAGLGFLMQAPAKTGFFLELRVLRFLGSFDWALANLTAGVRIPVQ
jgi:hypothetical protein